MIAIDNETKTIYITRGDATQEKFNKLAFNFPIYNFETKQEELYEFQLDDKISFVVVERKGYTKTEVLRKDYTLRDLGYTEPSTTPEIVLTEEDTKSFDLKDKALVYWYDIVLNDTTTILGFDDEGGKKLVVYPEPDENI
jgi:hypothetical protein